MASNRGLRPLPIPNNFDGAFNFGGFNFNTINFLEGIALGSVLALVAFLFTYNILYIGEAGTLVAVTVAGAAAGLVIGIKGINADPVHRYFTHVLKWVTSRRTTKYNPRVKYEITYALSLEEKEKQNVQVGVESKSLFMQYVDKIAKNQQKTQQQSARRSQDHHDEEYIFEDDIGVTERDVNAKKKRPAKKKPAPAKKKGGILNGITLKKKQRKAVKGN